MTRYFLPEIQKEYAKLKVEYQYGDATAKELDNYLRNYTIPDMNNVSASLAAASDMIRNYKTMTNMKLKESDPFFHCKANYEAASRGLKGALVALSFDIVKEAKDLYINKYPVADSAKDFRANLRGISGAFSGKSLKEICPTHYKKY